ncbi:MAG: hypothetical protein U0354_21005 [Candidatus Sericytochromatia bacterium]
MQELKKQISEIFIKWNLPTRQSAINEIMELFKAFGGCGSCNRGKQIKDLLDNLNKE